MDSELTEAELVILNKIVDDVVKLNKQLQRLVQRNQPEVADCVAIPEVAACGLDDPCDVEVKPIGSETSSQLLGAMYSSKSNNLIKSEVVVAASCEEIEKSDLVVDEYPSKFSLDFVLNKFEVDEWKVTRGFAKSVYAPSSYISICSPSVCQDVKETFHSCSIMQCGLNACQCILFDWKYVQLMLAWYMRSQNGLVTREPVLLSLRIHDNIVYGKLPATLNQIEGAALWRIEGLSNLVDPKAEDELILGTHVLRFVFLPAQQDSNSLPHAIFNWMVSLAPYLTTFISGIYASATMELELYKVGGTHDGKKLEVVCPLRLHKKSLACLIDDPITDDIRFNQLLSSSLHALQSLPLKIEKVKNLQNSDLSQSWLKGFMVRVVLQCKGQRKITTAMFNAMLEHGIQADSILYSSLIDGPCKNGRVKSALDMFRLMVEKGREPTLLTYNSLIEDAYVEVESSIIPEQCLLRWKFLLMFGDLNCKVHLIVGQTRVGSYFAHLVVEKVIGTTKYNEEDSYFYVNLHPVDYQAVWVFKMDKSEDLHEEKWFKSPSCALSRKLKFCISDACDSAYQTSFSFPDMLWDLVNHPSTLRHCNDGLILLVWLEKPPPLPPDDVVICAAAEAYGETIWNKQVSNRVWLQSEVAKWEYANCGVIFPFLLPPAKPPDECLSLQEYNIWCWTKCWDLALSSIQKGLILSSNWQGQLNTITADAKGSKEEIYSSRVKCVVKKDKPYKWITKMKRSNKLLRDELGNEVKSTGFGESTELPDAIEDSKELMCSFVSHENHLLLDPKVDYSALSCVSFVAASLSLSGPIYMAIESEELISPEDTCTQIHSVDIRGPALGLRLVSDTLIPDNFSLKIRFVKATDTAGIDDQLAQLGPELTSTLVIFILKSGGTCETRNCLLEVNTTFWEAGLNFARQYVVMAQESPLQDEAAKLEGWVARLPTFYGVGGRTSEMSAFQLLSAPLQSSSIRKMPVGATLMNDASQTTKLNNKPSALLALWWCLTSDEDRIKGIAIMHRYHKLLLFLLSRPPEIASFWLPLSFWFSSPRPPEVADLEDKVDFKEGGMLRTRIIGNIKGAFVF